MKEHFSHVNNALEAFTNKHDQNCTMPWAWQVYKRIYPLFVSCSTPPPHTLLILFAAFKLGKIWSTLIILFNAVLNCTEKENRGKFQ